MWRKAALSMPTTTISNPCPTAASLLINWLSLIKIRIFMGIQYIPRFILSFHPLSLSEHYMTAMNSVWLVFAIGSGFVAICCSFYCCHTFPMTDLFRENFRSHSFAFSAICAPAKNQIVIKLFKESFAI